jgi:hypothetical protein
MIFSENRFPPRIKCGAGFFRIVLQATGEAHLVGCPDMRLRA